MYRLHGRPGQLRRNELRNWRLAFLFALAVAGIAVWLGRIPLAGFIGGVATLTFLLAMWSIGTGATTPDQAPSPSPSPDSRALSNYLTPFHSSPADPEPDTKLGHLVLPTPTPTDIFVAGTTGFHWIARLPLVDLMIDEFQSIGSSGEGDRWDDLKDLLRR